MSDSNDELEAVEPEELGGAEEESSKEKLETPFDGLLKNLADNFAHELLPYLTEMTGFVSCESVGGEVELLHRLTDRVWRVTRELDDAEVESLYHLEFESSYDAHIGRRIGAYGWGLFNKYELPVEQLVWYVGKEAPSHWPQGVWRRPASYEMSVGGGRESSIYWLEIWLPGGFEAHGFVKEAPPFLLPFAAMMEGVDEALLQQIRDAIIKTGLPDGQKQELLVMLVFFASREMVAQRVVEVIGMAVLEKNPLTQFLLEKGREQGEAIGIEKGEAIGIEKGELRAKRATAVKLFGLGQSIPEIAEFLEVDEKTVASWLSEHSSGQ